ncbi:23S rRNA (uracil(1939)-C(5))-methyltransferase RlmD [Candidatus Peregrinibacteria bacterium HGW-Peregrinibacteria-1]|jgi:23S rRNA (uracil1939-C5)-methyltransferase|nr:MAG: 23S rRNA (uracil(1939)-C(5))-methyltransferase RlmD [Candidatus Peregrinibacteria bacterium HGW-Peregrinibacteria-1]
MQLKKGDQAELTVEKIIFGGKRMAKYGDVVVFLDEGMVGDVVLVEFSGFKKKFYEARVVEVVRPSEKRVEPACKHFEKCGGCQLQYMSYDDQLKLKEGFVRDCFERIGGFEGTNILPIIANEKEYYYRNKMEFSFGYDEAMNFTLGLHVPGRRFDILDVEECFLESEVAVDILRATREVMKKLGWEPFKYSDGTGFLKALYIREGERTGERLVNLVTSQFLPENFDEGLEEFIEIMKGFGGDITSLYWTEVISKRGERKRRIENLLFGKPFLTENMVVTDESGEAHKLSFDILPQAFFQVNTMQAEVLYGETLKAARVKKSDFVMDLFCGTGTIGLFMAKFVDKVVGVELNEESVKSARENALKNGIENIEFVVGDAKRVAAEVSGHPEVIIVDPPRAGLAPELVEIINDFSPARVVYVSCNPATLARDCREFLKYGYKVNYVQPVDMFPQTYHVENVVLIEKVGA